MKTDLDVAAYEAWEVSQNPASSTAFSKFVLVHLHFDLISMHLKHMTAVLSFDELRDPEVCLNLICALAPNSLLAKTRVFINFEHHWISRDLVCHFTVTDKAIESVPALIRLIRNDQTAYQVRSLSHVNFAHELCSCLDDPLLADGPKQFRSAQGQFKPQDPLAVSVGRLYSIRTLSSGTQCRVDEEDIGEPPVFEVERDAPPVFVDPAPPARDLLVYAVPDENVLLALLSHMPNDQPIPIVMSGYDGESQPRREAVAQDSSLRSVYAAIETTWNDFRGHTAQPYPEPCTTDWNLVTPKPLRFDFCPVLFAQLETIFREQVLVSSPDCWNAVIAQCLQTIKKHVLPFPQIVQTVRELLDAYTHGEHQFLHRIRDQDKGEPFWMDLLEALDLPKLIPFEPIKASPKTLRGATFRGLQASRKGPFYWNATPLPACILSRHLVVLHLFSGHRRSGDITSFMQHLPAPDNCTVTCIAIDIIFDAMRGDLSRSCIQEKWFSHMRQGGVIGFVAGPPCESFSIARSGGGIAGICSGDGGPRQIRTWKFPFGLPSTRVDERKHLALANKLLLFVLRLVLCMVDRPGFLLMEHPAEPEDAEYRDLPSSWSCAPMQVLRAHPRIRTITFFQGLLGAVSPKPTTFLVMGLETLEEKIEAFSTHL